MAYGRFQKVAKSSLILFLLLILSQIVLADLVSVDSSGQAVGTAPAQIRAIVNEAVQQEGDKTRAVILDLAKGINEKVQGTLNEIAKAKLTLSLSLLSVMIFGILLGDFIRYLINRKKVLLDKRLYEQRVTERIAIIEDNVKKTFNFIATEQRRNNLAIEAKIQTLLEIPREREVRIIAKNPIVDRKLMTAHTTTSASAVPQKAQTEPKPKRVPTEAQLKAREQFKIKARERNERLKAEKALKQEQDGKAQTT